MGFYFVDPETYKKYRDEVLSYSQSVQVNTQEFLPEEISAKDRYPIRKSQQKWDWRNGSYGKYA